MIAKTALAVTVIIFCCGFTSPEYLNDNEPPPDGKWIGAWSSPATSPYPTITGLNDLMLGPIQLGSIHFPVLAPAKNASGRSFRLLLKPSTGGEWLRVRLSNINGDQPVVFDNVNIAKPLFGSLIIPNNKTVLFENESRVIVPAGEEVVSDPIKFPYGYGKKLAVSFDVIEQQGPITWHSLAWEINYISPFGIGGIAKTLGFSFAVPTIGAFFLSGLDVYADDSAATLVTLGDSITEGFFHLPGTNKDWPSFLAKRLQDEEIPYGVLNQGISANKILESSNGSISALERFDRDVLQRPNVKSLIIFEGTNDLGGGANADDVFQAILSLVQSATSQGICVGVSNIPPREDAEWSAEKEVQRLRLNDMLFNHRYEFDAFIDLNSALEDPSHPGKPNLSLYFLDKLHPLPAGFSAIADAIPMSEMLPFPYGSCDR